MPTELPTPHGDKLQALLNNPKLPERDHGRVVQAIAEYHSWIQHLLKVSGNPHTIIEEQVHLLNHYKRYIELELIFDSRDNFLHRQKGQLKLDNSIIEEFLPILVTTVLADKLKQTGLILGPTTCFSGIRFESGMINQMDGGGLVIRAKDHDFAIARKLYIQTSHQQDFANSVTRETNIPFVAAECKTNLDKTMFQEAAATALDIKLAVPNAKYFLLCEWLDMTPISTSITAIDEILILRRAKRMSSSLRSLFSSYEGRRDGREMFVAYLDAHPFLMHIPFQSKCSSGL